MKRSIVLAISILTVQPVWAASQATTFATQAGAIAGFAQACGQDVTQFSGRVGEAIQALATDNADATAATTAFQQSRAAQYNAERTNNLVPCTQVLQDYATLPLLRDDYKTSVIARMQQTSAPAVTPINQTPGGSVPPANVTPALTPQTQVPPTNASPLPANNSYTVPPPTATIENNNTQSPTPPVPAGPTIMPPANNPAGYP